MAPSAWSSPEVQAWQELATDHQHEIRSMLFGDQEYHLLEATDYGKGLLRKKISYAMFGPPTSDQLTLSSQDEKRLSKIFNLVCKKNEGQKSFRVSFLTVECLTREGRFYYYVLRLHLADRATGKIVKSFFIDNVPRFYRDFDEFLENNRLPKCIMCFPATGSYYLQPGGNKFEVQFRKSPACKITNKVLRCTDIASVAVGTAAMITGTATAILAPVAIPAVVIGTWVAYGTSVFYLAGRGIAGLNDRRKRGQNWGLTSPEARNCWLSIGGVVAFVAAAGVSAKFGQSAGQAPVVITLTVSGLGVINGFANIFQKFFQGEMIRPMDWLYVVSAMLLFANVVMTAYQANGCLTEMLDKGATPSSIWKDMAAWVKGRPEFGRLPNKEMVMNFAPFAIFHVVPKVIEKLPTGLTNTCKLIAINAKQYVAKRLPFAEFAVRIASRLYEFWCIFGCEMQRMVEWFCKVKGKRSLCEIFDEITSLEALDFFGSLVTMLSWFRNQGADNNALDRLAGVIQLQEQYGIVQTTNGPKAYSEKCKQIFEILQNELNRQKTIYEEGFETAKKFSPNLTESEYQKVMELAGPVSDYFWEKALTQITKDFSNNASLLKLAKRLVKAPPGSCVLEDLSTGTTTYFFHGVTPSDSDQQLSRGQYFSVVREKLGSVLDGASLEVDRDSRIGFIRDLPTNAEGITCVIVMCVPEGGQVAGNIFVVKCKID